MERILDFLRIREGMRVLDLGAGSGYVSFPLAKTNPSCEIVGLDIVADTFAANRVRADRECVRNLSFVCYDGAEFPLESDSFDMVITRYALQHFPDINYSIGEVARVLRSGGSFFISDPCPNDCDHNRFVDEYMQLKKDGHIRLYTEDEWLDICGQHGMHRINSFKSRICFPRKKETVPGYEEILKKHDRAVIDSYNPVETDTEIYITENVNNIFFKKI